MYGNYQHVCHVTEPFTKHKFFRITPGPYFIKVKIFLKSGFKMNWSSYVLANTLNLEFLLTLMLILLTIS